MTNRQNNGGTAVITSAERTKTLSSKMKGNREAFEEALAGRMDADRFMRIVANAYLGDSRLQECSFLSIMTAALEAAEVGLKVDGEEAAIVGYRDRDTGEVVATFQPMYQGLVRLMLRAGARKVEARVVKTGDVFEYEYGLDPFLRHSPASTSERGDVTHAYAVIWLPNGERQFEVIDRPELNKIRQSSKSPNSPAWRNYPEQMFRKTVIKRLRKYVELDSEASAAFRKDDLLEAGRDIPLGEIDPQYERRQLQERAASHARREIAQLSGAVAQNHALSSGDPSPSREDSDPAQDSQAATGEPRDADPEPEEESGEEEEPEEAPEGDPDVTDIALLDFSGMCYGDVLEVAESFDVSQEIPSGKFAGEPWGKVIQEEPGYIEGVLRYGWILEDDELRKVAAHLFLSRLTAEQREEMKA